MNPPTFRHLLISQFLEQQLLLEINRLNLSGLCLRKAGIRTGWRKSRLPDLYVVALEQVVDKLDCSAVCETPPLLARIEPLNLFYYPDVMVTCDPEDRTQNYYKSHPCLIIEVLSLY